MPVIQVFINTNLIKESRKVSVHLLYRDGLPSEYYASDIHNVGPEEDPDKSKRCPLKTSSSKLSVWRSFLCFAEYNYL